MTEVLFFLELFGLAWIVMDHVSQIIPAAGFLTGCVLAIVSVRGLLSLEAEDRPRLRRYSATLLVLSFVVLTWSFVSGTDGFLAIGMPLLVLYGAKNFLAAGLRDLGGDGPGLGAVNATGIALSAPAVHPAT
ncbi:MAG: hypothetical protein AAF264_09020 [Pseudomonadota bacterium]